jgi:hypothetical protein
VLKKWTPRQGSPRNLGLAVAQLVKSAVICHWLQSRNGNATVTSDASQLPARRAPLTPTDQELPALLELESAIQTDRHNHECDCPEPDEELGSNR